MLVTDGDGTSFPTAAHLASYADPAPTTKSSGTSIHGEDAPRGGNRQLKRAMFLSAFAALHDPASRTYYDRCRARGKPHTQALLRLARQRINVLFAVLRDGTVADVLQSGQYGHTEVTERFEQKIAEFLGIRDAVAVTSGTAALHTALLAAGSDQARR